MARQRIFLLPTVSPLNSVHGDVRAGRRQGGAWARLYNATQAVLLLLTMPAVLRVQDAGKEGPGPDSTNPGQKAPLPTDEDGNPKVGKVRTTPCCA